MKFGLVSKSKVVLRDNMAGNTDRKILDKLRDLSKPGHYLRHQES